VVFVVISTLSELAGFAILAATAYAWHHLVGGAVAGAELVLIGYAAEGVKLDLRAQARRVSVIRNRRKAAKAARKAG
jgi:hypothetical protein